VIRGHNDIRKVEKKSVHIALEINDMDMFPFINYMYLISKQVIKCKGGNLF
jgi:hypothetical protein